MAGVLLDTHALYWLVSGDRPLADAALLAIADSQDSATLLVSAITAWELAIAAKKNRPHDRPDLGDDAPDRWFGRAVAAMEARVVPIRHRIATEAARVVERTGHKDPGDCFLIATARVRRVPIVTRDPIIRDIARDLPGYLDVVVC